MEIQCDKSLIEPRVQCSGALLGYKRKTIQCRQTSSTITVY